MFDKLFVRIWLLLLLSLSPSIGKSGNGSNASGIGNDVTFSGNAIDVTGNNDANSDVTEAGKFSIDSSAQNFMLNGHPFRYVSGSISYPRIHPAQWNDRLRKIRAAGMNAIQMYVEWRYHEETPGQFNFQGNRDVAAFVKMAAKNDLYVLLRPGPYIDAEREMGGLPSWLLSLHPDVRLRSSDPKFMRYVDRWLTALYGQLANYTIGHKGPIIMVQIENEYGSFATQNGGQTDTEYLVQLRDLATKHMGKSVLLYSTDGGGSSPENIRKSKIPGVYSTVDFGATENFTLAFHNQRLFEPTGPLVNSEFYTGWLDHWAEPHSTVNSSLVSSVLDRMLALGASVNLYMAHGGTSFGFSNGANLAGQTYQPCPTSYDYDAPISEAGDLTQKYFDIKNVIKKYLAVPDIPVNKSDVKGNYGSVTLTPVHSLLEASSGPAYDLGGKVINSTYPLTFEAMNHSTGIVVYQTLVTDLFKDPAKLSVPGIRDRGYVFVGGWGPVGILDRMSDITYIPLSIRPGQKLEIFVENMGRVAFGLGIKDFKGITSNVTLNGITLKNWSMKALPLDNPKRLMKKLHKIQAKRTNANRNRNAISSMLASSNGGGTMDWPGGAMTFWQGSFQGCVDGSPRDSFLDLSGWRKGLAFVNGFNLGRYWPVVGPQLTLYVPWPVLHRNCSQANSIVIFEQEKPPCIGPAAVKHGLGSAVLNCTVKFVTQPTLNGPVPLA